ncbi:hypothetical protein QOK74_07945 [Staphylococcus saprophyticus]|uniref:hypothetical protein n=1 Tax=Staphylococcus saprophyticus TaxID=29385 RepID=UPI0024C34102|nr:hypothetical protein [Staphylococcus saprophyticus]MDK1672801.1 hypothetical protein [Staphylococcus saprophyticus]
MFDLNTNPDLFRRIHWSSDWNGDEVGYPEINVVGLYSYHELNLYIDMETLEVLEAWFDVEDEI